MSNRLFVSYQYKDKNGTGFGQCDITISSDSYRITDGDCLKETRKAVIACSGFSEDTQIVIMFWRRYEDAENI